MGHWSLSSVTTEVVTGPLKFHYHKIWKATLASSYCKRKYNTAANKVNKFLQEKKQKFYFKYAAMRHKLAPTDFVFICIKCQGPHVCCVSWSLYPPREGPEWHWVHIHTYAWWCLKGNTPWKLMLIEFARWTSNLNCSVSMWMC